MSAIRRSGVFAIAAIGAVAATLCDANHVHTGTLRYTDPWLFGQAWWVLPLFAVSFFGMSIAYLLLSDTLSRLLRTARSRTRGDTRDFVEALSAFVLVYLASGFGGEEPALLSGIFYSLFVLRWLFTYERGWLLVLALTMATGGMAGEGMLGAAGLAGYRHEDVFHVPLWLGALYMHGAFALREGMRCLVYR